MIKQPLPEARSTHERGRLHALLFCGLACLLCLLLGLAPQIDLDAAHFFYVGGHFIGDTPAGRWARDVARITPLLILFGMVSLWVLAKLGLNNKIAPHGRTIAWLVLSLALGPGLLINGLKDISHRPRPVHVRDFGGTDDFRPFYRFDGACARNCSFPSGEASAAFWTLVPASLAPPPLRAAALVAATLFGLATGGLRMAFGGHFLSDVLFAGVLTIATALALRRIKPRAAASRHDFSNPPESRL